MKQFKIRASACGQIMTSDRSGKGMGKTAQSYCQMWLKEQLYGHKTEISSKYMTKGVIMEDDAIDLTARVLDLGALFKNTQHFSNDHISGTPDVILPDRIIDTKCSWSFEQFPLFDLTCPNNDYFYQGQCYMALTDRPLFQLAYCLVDTPRHIVEREAAYFCRDNGYGRLEDNPEILAEFIAKNSYSDVADNLRLKVFDIPRDDAAIEAIVARVETCREYIKQLESAL